MLLNEEGKVVWSYHKPEDVPEEYSLPQVATFARWYLNDYPVRCWVRDDGLLVVGSPKGSVWKQDSGSSLGNFCRLRRMNSPASCMLGPSVLPDGKT